MEEQRNLIIESEHEITDEKEELRFIKRELYRMLEIIDSIRGNRPGNE